MTTRVHVFANGVFCGSADHEGAEEQIKAELGKCCREYRLPGEPNLVTLDYYRVKKKKKTS